MDLIKFNVLKSIKKTFQTLIIVMPSSQIMTMGSFVLFVMNI